MVTFAAQVRLPERVDRFALFARHGITDTGGSCWSTAPAGGRRLFVSEEGTFERFVTLPAETEGEARVNLELALQPVGGEILAGPGLDVRDDEAELVDAACAGLSPRDQAFVRRFAAQ